MMMILVNRVRLILFVRLNNEPTSCSGGRCSNLPLKFHKRRSFNTLLKYRPGMFPKLVDECCITNQ